MPTCILASQRPTFSSSGLSPLTHEAQAQHAVLVTCTDSTVSVMLISMLRSMLTL